ncbi:MAG: RNA methyltransferase [Deltaproteobacteria bacterium]|nr:RNA methyltransferase [Deltaproteobacteria bacterium]
MERTPSPAPDTAPDRQGRALRLRELVQRHPLASELTPRRLARVLAVLERRLGSVTVVMENLSDPHNVSAVLRTAEGLGLSELHVVEQPNKWEKNKAISKGAERWIEIVRHQGLARCLGDLSARGFSLFAADVGAGCVPVDEVPVEGPVALVFGSEHAGLSKRALSLTDARFTVPMAGMVESFNVSVSAALALWDLSSRRRRALARSGERGDLDDATLEDRADLYLRRAVKNAELIRQLEERGALPRRDRG